MWTKAVKQYCFLNPDFDLNGAEFVLEVSEGKTQHIFCCVFLQTQLLGFMTMR